ncbi:glycosyl hydrolase family 32 [Pseudoclavibacter sp. AY1F1]|uniref:glycoside hydrolase family 32 protein n=1 Tax=Pseudoclavibacter sp. AY1F1 TaxID=2080583 RepID=UPI000CE754CE|nr:glycoside hydrolase family 32 protein [Pseudoclavibacter sp. AY1F1]PPF44436.1 glycosyl hydrolase family 32 [Pseudoclavibacter sp. AY1F1]
MPAYRAELRLMAGSLHHTAELRVPRPIIHFAPERHWMNDPNGLIHHQGRWHVYFQFNPEGNEWGNMSWGHASSSDLLSWTEHPVALRYSPTEQIYSGSIVHDQTSEHDRLRAIYTSAYSNGKQAQSEATSSDGGMTWTRSPHNPILDRGTSNFRDPKVIRCADPEGRERWILLAVEAEDRQVLFYGSDDLETWDYLSSFGPTGPVGVVWECPDLVRLPLDEDPERARWVLTLSTNPVGDEADREGSSMSYVVGDFDGHTFTAEAPGLRRLDHGRDFYAGVTFADAPSDAPIMLGWMSNWQYADQIPSAPWRGAMSLPRELSLRELGGRAQLVQRPLGLDEALLRSDVSSAPVPAGGASWNLSVHSVIDLAWDPRVTGNAKLVLRGQSDFVEVTHDTNSGELTIRRGGRASEAVHPDFPSLISMPLDPSAPVRLLICLDGPLLEVFANGGEQVASHLVLLGGGAVSASITTDRPALITVAVGDLAGESQR